MSSGFAIFSNDIRFETDIISQYFADDALPTGIVYVYSLKAGISPVLEEVLGRTGRTVVSVPFEDYNKIAYASAIESMDLSRTVMIIKDLRFMIKRLDERLSMMQIKHSCYKKIVIDAVPYMVNPWKFYFPYSFFDKKLLGYAHSYAFEAAIRNFEDDPSMKDPCDPASLAQAVKTVTHINYSSFFNFKIDYRIYSATDEERKAYEALKNKLFDEGLGIRAIIRELHSYAKSVCKDYNVPLDLKRVYDWVDRDSVVICRTDLKVDTYLCSEIDKLVRHTNALVGYLYGG